MGTKVTTQLFLPMYSQWQLAAKYFKYIFTASNGKGHGMHSPFLFHFITKILNEKNEYPEYKKVEELRNNLLVDDTELTIQDFGAGSFINKSNVRTIASIAKNAAKPKKYGQLLFRMVKEYQPETILELGTSLGITTSYLALAKPDAKVLTMEGANEIATVAKNNFSTLGINNISIKLGDFNHNLIPILSGFSNLDFVFIDGNHQQGPTERYFAALLAKANNDTILIFDDIHWSKEMEAAWKTIKEHPDVRCSVDLFFIGIVLFRKEFLAKQHFVIRF